MLLKTSMLSTRGFTAALLVLAVLGTSCGKKDESNPVIPPTASTATLTGYVLGSNGGGLPLAGVVVTSTPAATAGASATTNSFGVFTLTVPANTALAIHTSRSGFAEHPFSIQLTTGETRAVMMVLAAYGATANVAAAAGGKVTDINAATAITLPANYVSGPASAFVHVTGLDPTTEQVLGMPGTFTAESSTGSVLSLNPSALAEVRIDDGASTEYPLAANAILEMELPASFAADPAYFLGASVPCFLYDHPSGHWKYYKDGSVAISSVNGEKCVKLIVDHLSWFAAGFLSGGNGCVSGFVFNGVVPVAGATVQAYPGGTAITAADGSYRVSAPPATAVQLLASRAVVGAVQVAQGTQTAGNAGGACGGRNLTLQGGGPAPTFTIAGQLMRGRTAGIPREQAFVKVTANTSPSPTPMTGSLVQIGDGVTLRTLPHLGGGVFGVANNFTLVSGQAYTLHVDLEPDGTIDASATVLMPGKPLIETPVPDALVEPSFNATWSDPVAGMAEYHTRYVGSIESLSFGTFPSIFAVDAPTQNYVVGTGTGQPPLPNNPLAAGSYLMRLWATDGPIRYAVGGQTVFATPNIVTLNTTGWFSAIAQGDSVFFGSIGDGTRPGLAMRARR